MGGRRGRRYSLTSERRPGRTWVGGQYHLKCHSARGLTTPIISYSILASVVRSDKLPVAALSSQHGEKIRGRQLRLPQCSLAP